jgi:hypothetical protein
MDDLILWGLRIAGAGQIALGCLHRVGMRSMGWKEDLAKVRPLNAQIFLSLFGYITAINVSMGVLGVAAPWMLIDGSAQAVLLSAFIGAYWSVRLCLQLFHYRWHEAPGIVGARISLLMLPLGFLGFAAAHWLALLHNLGAWGG